MSISLLQPWLKRLWIPDQWNILTERKQHFSEKKLCSTWVKMLQQIESKVSLESSWKWSHSVVSDSSWPHGLQPSRLLHLWDLPGKSTGVGCHCLLQCMKLKSEVAQFRRSVSSNSVRLQRRQPTRLPHPWDSPGKNTGVSCHFLLRCMKVKSESEVAQSCPLVVTPWTAAYQAPPFMRFSRHEYWSVVPLASPLESSCA